MPGPSGRSELSRNLVLLTSTASQRSSITGLKDVAEKGQLSSAQHSRHGNSLQRKHKCSVSDDVELERDMAFFSNVYKAVRQWEVADACSQASVGGA